jgi:PAS domain S-box-containing protein
MDTALLPNIPLWAINLFLAGLVYCWHPRKPSHQAFASLVLTMVGWSFGVKMFYSGAAHPSGLVWGRLAFVTASLIGTSFAVFCQVFPERKHPHSRRVGQLFILAGVVMAALSFTPMVLQKLEIEGTGGIRRTYGPLYPIFAAFMLATFGHGIWTLSRQWRIARGRGRLQIRYLGLGLGVFFCGGLITNLILPALMRNSHVSLYGPYFTIPFVGLTAHAIIRHRLMDSRLVVRQSVTYALSLGAVATIIWAVFVWVGKGFALQPLSSSLTLAVGIIAAAIFHPVRVAIQRLFDRYCYRAGYDYSQAIKTGSQVLAGLLRLEPLCERLTTFILSTLKAEEAAVYLCHDQLTLERWAYENAGEGRGTWIEPTSVTSPGVIALVARTRNPVLRDEFARWVERDEVDFIAAEFARLRCEVIVPLIIEGGVAAVITVGEKLSGDPFFTHDIEFLATLGHQAGIALKRAQLYEDIAWMKEYNESILRYMESGLIAASHEGVVTVINEAASRMIGIPAAAVVGLPITNLIPCGLGVPLLDTLAGKITYTNHQTTLMPASGQTLPIALSTSILRGRSGEPGGAILVVNDLSQIKALEEEKRRIERLASIGAFMSGIAHEIKNPLVAIKTLAELLPEQYDDEEFRDTFTKVTLNEVDRIDTLVRRLRSLSSGSAVPLQPMTIITPLEETLSLISGELIRRKITVMRAYQDPLPPIMGDHDQLKQVFVNLCLNSLEAMGEGGTLKVTVESIDNHAGQPAELIIQIADTGPGVPAEHLAHIFDPFFTLKDEGTGLGLAICRGILDHHRGAISAANNAEGSGAILTLMLPAAQGVEAYEIAATCH